MTVRPCVTRPHSPVLRRDDGVVQLGLGPAAVLLPGVTAAEATWLSTLDGTRSLTRAVAEARVHGVGRERAGGLVDRLLAQGHLVLHSSPTSRSGEVVVIGRGALPALLADVLAASTPARVRRLRPGGEPQRDVHLAVLVTAVPPAVGEALPWTRAGALVLPVVAAPTHASVGPLLRPGSGPCLHCVELTRRTLDPSWPGMRTQLGRPRVGDEVPVDGHPPVRLVAAGLATSVVLDHLAGVTLESGWSYDVAVPGPTFERHRWPVHPHCPTCAPTLPAPARVSPGLTVVPPSRPVPPARTSPRAG